MERTGVDVTRSSYERFAIPYSFKPRLSFVEAVVAASGALLRIFLGSLLFAVWGTYTLLAWNAVRNVFARGIVLVVLVTLFAVSMAAVILAISALVRMVWPHREATKGAPANLTRT
jgi:hypothetical protein